LLIKTDSLGNELWRTTWGGYFDDCGNNLAATPDGGVIACGCFSSEPPEGNESITFGYIRKMDGARNLVWDKTYPRKTTAEGGSVRSFAVCRVLENGNIAAAGWGYALEGNSTTVGRRTPWIVILDEHGIELMNRPYTSILGPKTNAEFQDIQPTADGGFIAGGTYYPRRYGQSRCVYCKAGRTWL
jgi:hypothetical protein